MSENTKALREEFAKLRRKLGVPDYLADKEGEFLLNRCAAKGLITECQTMIQDGVDVNRPNPIDGCTPLHAAAKSNKPDVILLIIKSGAVRSLFKKDKEGRTPLDIAKHLGLKNAITQLEKAQSPAVELFQKMTRSAFQNQKADMLQQTIWGHRVFYDNDVVLDLRCDLCNSTDLKAQLPVKWEAIKGHTGYCYECDGRTDVKLVFMDEVRNKDICVVSPKVTEPELKAYLRRVEQYSADRDAPNLPDSDRVSLYVKNQHLVVRMPSNMLSPEITNGGPIFGKPIDSYTAENVNDVIGDGHTILWFMAELGNIAGMRDLFKIGARVDAPNKNNEIPLHPAAKRGHRDVIIELLSHGADVDVLDVRKRTPLSFAIECDNADAGVALLDAGADPRKAYLGKVPLPNRQWVIDYLEVRKIEEKLDACKSLPVLEQVSFARLNELLDDFNRRLTQNPKDVTLYIQRARVFRRLNRLHEARDDYEAAINLSNGAVHTMGTRPEKLPEPLRPELVPPRSPEDLKVLTQLHDAAKKGDVAKCTALLKRGVVMKRANPQDGNTVLHWAAYSGNEKLIELLFAEGVVGVLFKKNKAGHTPLDIAKRRRHQDAITMLQNAEMQSVLDFQCKTHTWFNRQSPDMLKQPIMGHKVFNDNHVVQTLRCGLCDSTDLDESVLPTWESILGLDAHCYECNGRVPVNLVFMDEKLGKDICVVSPTVTERELQVRLSDVGQYSPKRDARNLPASPTASKYAAVPKHLVNNIAPDYYNSTNIDYVMHDGHTSLWCMSAKGNAEGVRWFLDSGANVDSLSKNFETPLHPAVYNGHREVVLELVSRGADVDAVRFGDRTPLSLAIECDKADAGVALLDAGADIEKVTAKSPYPEWVTNYLNVREMEGKLDACKSTPVLEQVPLARLNTFLDELNSWLEENPEDVSSYIQRARVFRRLNRFSEACVDYGCAFNLSNDLDHAMETFDRAIKMNPKNVIAIIERGNLARKSNILPLAIAYYKKACALDPNNVKALIKLGSAYRKAGENDKALDAYNKARGLDPNSIKAQSKGGWVLASLQRWSEASDAYKSVLALDPARKSAHQNYIHLLILLKRWSEAAESCEQACEMFPEDVNLEKFHKKAQKELEKSYQAKAEQNVADQNESVSDNRM